MNDTPIYLDNNATTPIDPAVLEAMMPWLTNAYGNAASQTHAFGRDARAAVDRARAQIARLIGAKTEEIVFTSGATESTNLALRGYAETVGLEGLRIVTAPTEHKATLDTARDLARRGADLVELPVDGEGKVDLQALDDAILPEAGRTIVSLMMVNNETGLIHPAVEIGALCGSRGAVFHCDAAQAFGKVPIDVHRMGIDLLSVSGHKIYAPKGVGILFAGPRAGMLAEQITGGGHEGGRRSGTLNVPGIVGLGAAADIAARGHDAEGERIRALRDRLRGRLEDALGPLRLNGPESPRIDGNLNLSFPDVDPEMLLLALPDIAVSSGSACNSDTIEPSYVLKAIGLTDMEAATAIRFGIGRFNTEDEIDRAAEQVIEAVRGLRAMSGS